MGLEGLEAREGREDGGEVVARLGGRVGLDGHEDGELVQCGRDGLGGRGGGVLCVNKELDGLCVVLLWVVVVEHGETAREGGEIRVELFGGVGHVVREPVGEGWHVRGRDGQDVDEALVAPGGQALVEGVEIGRVVQAHDGVGHVELVLVLDSRGGGRGEVESGEVPVKVREGLGQGVGLHLARREGRG